MDKQLGQLIKLFSSKVATRKILEKMKHDENLRSFEGSSGVVSDGDELDDTDDDEELSPVKGDDIILNEEG